jgi:hypothetical protein
MATQSVVAQQAGAPLFLSLVPYPGAPNVLELKSLGPPPLLSRLPEVFLLPRFPHATIH